MNYQLFILPRAQKVLEKLPSNIYERLRDEIRSLIILISRKQQQSVLETLYLLSIPGMKESIQKGMKTPVVKCDRGLRW